MQDKKSFGKYIAEKRKEIKRRRIKKKKRRKVKNKITFFLLVIYRLK